MVAIVVWLTITAVRAMAQDNVTLSGYIRDGASLINRSAVPSDLTS